MELAGRSLNSATPGSTCKCLSEGAVIDVDRARMSQAVTNLLSNAVKYSSQASGIVVRGNRDGDVVRLSVKDEGIGIAPHMLDRVFEPFVQEPQPLDRAVGGLGLGLAIVRNIVRAHGGTVHAHSDGSDRGPSSSLSCQQRNTLRPVQKHQKTCIAAGDRRAEADSGCR